MYSGHVQIDRQNGQAENNKVTQIRVFQKQKKKIPKTSKNKSPFAGCCGPVEVKSCETLVDGAVGAEVVEVVEIPVVVSLGFGLKKRRKD